jgi:predicted nucleotidyltransferase
MLRQPQVVQEETLARRVPYLTPNERTGLATFVNRLYQCYATHLLQVVLFGSKARRDFDEESDLDVLVVVHMPDNHYWEYWHEIVDIAADVGLTYGLVISSIVKNARDYAEICVHQSLLARDLERDGIVLWTTLPSTHTSQPI